MRICPTCRTTYPDAGRSTCTKDGDRLVSQNEYWKTLNDPLIGTTIAGRYEIQGHIGAGGMGAVYRAEQVGLGRSVALKILKKELVSDRDVVGRFQREAKAMSLLVHPCTVRVFDFGEDPAEGHLYLAMELLEGELLTAWIEREETPPVLEAIGVAQSILRSLAEAHSKGLIHRDLKPDNIFLARVDGHLEPVVKVLDFGIAKAFRGDIQIDQLETQAGTVFGTPRYMSPEQAQGKTLDHRSDLYGVGVLLYQMLTGQPPYTDDDAVVVMAKHIRERPKPPREAAPGRPIPRSLDQLVMKALAKDPNGRFENADEFDAALSDVVPDVEAELAGRRSSPFVDTVGRLPRIPLLVGAALVSIAAIGASAMVWSASIAPDPEAELGTLPEPAAPSATAEAPPAPPSSATRAITVASEPTGAEIWVDDRRVGTTPEPIEVEHGAAVELTLRAPEHEPLEVTLRERDGDEQRFTLEPRAEEPAPRARGARRAPPATADRGATAPPPPPPVAPQPSSDPYERFD